MKLVVSILVSVAALAPHVQGFARVDELTDFPDNDPTTPEPTDGNDGVYTGEPTDFNDPTTPTPIDYGNDPETPEPTPTPIDDGNDPETPEPTDGNDSTTPEPTPTPIDDGNDPTTDPTAFEIVTTEAATMGPTDFNDPETPEPTDNADGVTPDPTEFDIVTTEAATMGPTDFNDPETPEPTSSCMDTVGFRDEYGYVCTDHIPYDCSNAEQYTTEYEYTVEGHQSIMENCRGSCELCEDFPCVCRSLWTNPGSNECVDQIGCPETTCDGSFIPYCQIANPGCVTEETQDGFSYTTCDSNTPIWDIF